MGVCKRIGMMSGGVGACLRKCSNSHVTILIAESQRSQITEVSLN